MVRIHIAAMMHSGMMMGPSTAMMQVTVLIILSYPSSLLSCNCLSLSLSLLFVGNIRNATPQQGQNTPLW